jgi:hypothetical protein
VIGLGWKPTSKPCSTRCSPPASLVPPSDAVWTGCHGVRLEPTPFSFSELRGDTPMVWPGPPWVRVLRGEPGPAGAPVVAEGADKTAWAIAERQPGHAAPLGRIIALGGGDAPTTTELSAAAAMQALAPHTVWLTEPEARVATLFPRVASVASAVPATGVSLPRHAGWRDDLLNLVRV